MAARLLTGSLLIAPALGACGTPPPSEPTPAARPDTPGRWRTITSDEGDVEVALPREYEVMITTGGILAQPPAIVGGRTPELEIWTQGPAFVDPQPTGGEPLREWVERAGFVPRAGDGGVTFVAERSEREVVLPSGRALEVAITVQPDTSEASRVIVYAIATQEGIAILRFICSPPARLAERADELELIARLVRFGAEVGG